VAAALTAACGSGRAVTPPPAATPSPYAPAASQPAAPPTPPAKPRADPVRYGPSAVRYLVHRQLHIQQALGDQNQMQDLGVRIFVVLAITGPADAVGYPTTVTVDSMVADSGTPPRVADNLVKVRKLVFAGRVVAKGEFVNAVPSDSALAQSVVQLLGNFRDFLPRLPAGGVKPGAAWTDTVETTQKGSDAEGSRRTIMHASATPWGDQAGVPTLRVESSQSYSVSGSGKNAGQPYELAGSGSANGTALLTADGRYMGGESRDSTTLTIRLPAQGVSVPVVQLTRTTIAVLP
jgi:hypothetical protein